MKFEGLNVSHLLQILKKCGKVKIAISRIWKLQYKVMHNNYSVLFDLLLLAFQLSYTLIFFFGSN